MKRLFAFASFIFLMLLTSCGGPKAYFDYDQNISFNQFQSFNFYPEMDSGLNQLDEERLKKALTVKLQEEGYTLTEIPDFKINFYTEIFKKQNNNTIGIGVGGGAGAVGGGVSSGVPLGTSKVYMSVTLEFANAIDNELYWQAVVEHKIKENATPEERMLFFTEIVNEALENYPPEE
ncbi:protein of unknown function [Mesonia phycicola]|uniref:DUF4136 domain-containing protein n=1 Tax=Mesonia phycicola TaxID=579105 RepID=A0A1M6B009_9FLAO|nr:DUF4136 domain-containing protein [Mesonia phycicola]SHI42065.1 protein of unknown function [Mesonia phycicola]